LPKDDEDPSPLFANLPKEEGEIEEAPPLEEAEQTKLD